METGKDYSLSNFDDLWILKLSYKTTKYFTLDRILTNFLSFYLKLLIKLN